MWFLFLMCLHCQTLHKFLIASIAPSSLHRMGDLLRLLQTTAGGWRFIGGTPERGATSDGIVSSSIFSLFSLVKCWIQIETNFRAEVDDFNGKNYKKFNRQQLGQLCTSLYIVEASVPIIESNYWYFLHDCFSFVLYLVSFYQGLNPADIL